MIFSESDGLTGCSVTYIDQTEVICQIGGCAMQHTGCLTT